MAYQPIAQGQQPYLPQQQPYPPQQQPPYPPPQPGHPPQYGSTSNTTVVTVQPTPAGTVHVYDTKKVNANGALVLSVIVAIVCGFMSPITLCCSVPAVILAIMGMDGPNLEERASNVRISFILSIIALTFGLVVSVIVVILVAVRKGA